MNPITPHLSEELYQGKGSDGGLASTARWPVFKEDKIDRKAEAGEELVRTAMEGMRNVLKLAKLEQVKKFTLFIAEPWSYDVVNLISQEISVTRNVGEIMRKVLELEEHKAKGKEVSKLVLSLIKDVSKIPSLVTSSEEEFKVMEEAKRFLEKEFSCPVEIIKESLHEKARSALPGKVGILVE